MFNKSINDLLKGISLYHVWIHQAYHEVSSKYKRTVLGSIWISGGMVTTSLAIAIVFGGIQGQNLPEVLPYIMGGILCFALPGYILSEAPEVFMNASGIIKNHSYPFSYYSFESVTRGFIVFIHNVVAYYIAMAILSKMVVPNWTLLPALVIVYINSIFWGMLISMLAARFRDMRFLLPFVSQIVFFLTPVFWHPNNMSGWRVLIIRFNPFYGLTEILRSPFLGFAAPVFAWEQSCVSLLMACMLWIGFYSVYRGKIAFWV